MSIRKRWLLLVLALSTLTLFVHGTAHADGPLIDDALHSLDSEGRYHPSVDAFTPAILQQVKREPKTCTELAAAVDDVAFLMSDADLTGGNGSKVCVFSDPKWDSYVVILLNQRSIDEWRQTKSQFLPMLSGHGIDLCSVAFWGTLNAAIGKAQTINDREDQGQRCDPVFFTHGPDSEAREDEVRNAVSLALAKADELFGWQPSFTIRVHVYDEHVEFVKGVWVDGGADDATPRSLEDVGGVAKILANGMYGFLLDISDFSDETGLQMLVSHEFAHIVQGSMMGCTCTMPYWAVEGGAEYFASLVVGPDEQHLQQRFRTAISDQYAIVPPSLKRLMTRPNDRKSELAGYSRGYAAFRYLAQDYGDDAFVRMHRDRPSGTSDRYIANLTYITGQTLDDFDTALGQWLRQQADTLPTRASPPNTTIQPNSPVAYLGTGRPARAGTFDEVASFSARDPGAVIVVEWKCLSKAVRGQVVVLQPNGRQFANEMIIVQPGCGELDEVVFDFDTVSAGKPARSLPGTWRVQVLADGVVQATTSFSLN